MNKTDLAKLNLTPQQTNALHQHLSKWQNRLRTGCSADFNEAFKRLIYSWWLSEELKQFMTLPLSEALLSILLDYEWVSGQLYYDYIPHELNKWAYNKLSQ